MRHPTLPALIAAAGRALYGEEWGRALAADLKVNERTIQRIAKAARAGEGYRSIGPGLLRDAADLVGVRVSELRAVERQLRAAAAVLPAEPPTTAKDDCEP
jgi:hypothetical protein